MNIVKDSFEWFLELCKYARECGFTYVEDEEHAEVWQDYYDRGYSPKDAFDEDITYMKEFTRKNKSTKE